MVFLTTISFKEYMYLWLDYSLMRHWSWTLLARVTSDSWRGPKLTILNGGPIVLYTRLERRHYLIEGWMLLGDWQSRLQQHRTPARSQGHKHGNHASLLSRLRWQIRCEIRLVQASCLPAPAYPVHYMPCRFGCPCKRVAHEVETMMPTLLRSSWRWIPMQTRTVMHSETDDFYLSAGWVRSQCIEA